MAAKELDSVVPRPKRDQCMKATKRLKTPNKESPFHPAPLLGGVGGGFIAPIHVRILEVFTIHEPYPLIPSFSPSGGEGARRAVEGDSDRFMAPTHVKTLEVFTIHEPSEAAPGFGVRQSSGALAVVASRPKAPEHWHTPG